MFEQTTPACVLYLIIIIWTYTLSWVNVKYCVYIGNIIICVVIGVDYLILFKVRAYVLDSI